MKTTKFLAILTLSFVAGCVKVTGVKVSVGSTRSSDVDAALAGETKVERTPSATLYDASGHPLYTDPGW